jgi:thiol-disulfide isomerase/thioredoxin
MKIKRILASLVLLLLGLAARAQEPAATKPAEELSALVTQIRTKLSTGKDSAADLAPELAAFDALRAKYRDQRTAEVAQITQMQASLYGQILGDLPKAKALSDELQRDYAGQPIAARAQQMYEAFEKAAQAKLARDAIIGKKAPDLTFTWSTREGLKTLADLKGKVVVLDFWATWCGPCVASFPQVRELTAHYKDADVVVLGVTSLQGSIMGLETARIDTRNDPAREMALMKDYVKAKEMTWTVVFSAEPVFNEAYGVTGIPHMAIIAPDGTVRHSGMHPAEPHADKVKKIDALLKEFNKPVPGSVPARS